MLDVSNNKISELSDQVAYHQPLLSHLNLENNALTKLPTQLGFMPFKTLKIDGNPIKLIKRTVIEKGTASILDYLKSRHVGEVP